MAAAAAVADAPAVAVKRRRPPRRRRESLFSIAEHSLLIVLAACFLAPFIRMFLTSLMTNHQALSTNLWPEPFQPDNTSRCSARRRSRPTR